MAQSNMVKGKSLQDFLNAAIRVGWLRATPEGEYPYTWNPEVTHEFIAAFVGVMGYRTKMTHHWKWAEETFGIKNLNPIYHTKVSSKVYRILRYEDIVKQVIDIYG